MTYDTFGGNFAQNHCNGHGPDMGSLICRGAVVVRFTVRKLGA